MAIPSRASGTRKGRSYYHSISRLYRAQRDLRDDVTALQRCLELLGVVRSIEFHRVKTEIVQARFKLGRCCTFAEVLQTAVDCQDYLLACDADCVLRLRCASYSLGAALRSPWLREVTSKPARRQDCQSTDSSIFHESTLEGSAHLPETPHLPLSGLVSDILSRFSSPMPEAPKKEKLGAPTLGSPAAEAAWTAPSAPPPPPSPSPRRAADCARPPPKLEEKVSGPAIKKELHSEHNEEAPVVDAKSPPPITGWVPPLEEDEDDSEHARDGSEPLTSRTSDSSIAEEDWTGEEPPQGPLWIASGTPSGDPVLAKVTLGDAGGAPGGSPGIAFWETMPCIDRPCYRYVMHHRKLYACAGNITWRTKSNSAGRLMCYDPLLDEWETIGLGLRRTDFSITSVGKFLYACGGEDAGRMVVVRTVDRCKPTRRTTSWENLPGGMVHRRQGLAAAALDPESLLVCGGSSSLSGMRRAPPPHNSVEVLDLTASPPAWRLRAPMLSERVKHAAARVGSGVYVCGGCNADSSSLVEHDLVTATCERYDLETQVWSQLPPMPVARQRLVAVGMCGSLYVFGGHTSCGDSTKIEYLASGGRFDVEQGSWSLLLPSVFESCWGPGERDRRQSVEPPAMWELYMR